MSRLLHAAKGGANDPLLLLLLMFFGAWGVLAGVAALASRRQRTNRADGSPLAVTAPAKFGPGCCTSRPVSNTSAAPTRP